MYISRFLEYYDGGPRAAFYHGTQPPAPVQQAGRPPGNANYSSQESGIETLSSLSLGDDNNYYAQAEENRQVALYHQQKRAQYAQQATVQPNSHYGQHQDLNAMRASTSEYEVYLLPTWHIMISYIDTDTPCDCILSLSNIYQIQAKVVNRVGFTQTNHLKILFAC